MGLYLALGGGPPGFTPGFPCLALLGKDQGGHVPFAYGTITLYGRPFQVIRLGSDFVTPRRPVHRQDLPTTPTAHRSYGPLGTIGLG